MTRLYKFYKNNCAPCYALSRILVQIEIPKNVKIIPINVELEENKELISKYEIAEVPVLSFENGRKIIGLQSKSKIENFINMEN